WAPTQVVDALQKICHDLWVLRVGGQPRYFAPEDLPSPPGLATLAHWSKALMASARTAEHPFNAGLMLEALVSEARRALHSRA
ncbi:MAG TPA: DNA polymerase III subunit delta', partial [Burkholderiaceae bacterium]